MSGATWDEEFDVVVIGSGGGGLVAGLAAREAGGSALVVEKRDLIGGSTAMSGGVVWLPNNPLMQRDGVADSDEDGLRYFAETVGEVGPASSPERREAFISEGREMVRFLEERGARFTRCENYSDYYSNRPGGSAIGRSIEPLPYDGRQLGEWLPRVQPGMAMGLGMNVMTNELRDVQYVNRSLRSFVIAARVQLRTWRSSLMKRPVLTNGTALVASVLKMCLDRGVEVRTGTAFEEYVVEDGVVTGVRLRAGDTVRTVRARRGVVVAAGGFAHNPELREEFGGTQLPDPSWSIANPGDTGDTVAATLKLGAKTDFMDEAWWLPGPPRALSGGTLSAARNRPRTIIVGADGKRFANESNSYVELGKAMFARNKTTAAVPAWLIFDDGYRRAYAHTRSLFFGRLPKEWLASSEFKQASTLSELAAKCGIDAAGLHEQVARFNTYASEGKDPQFGRGESEYNHCLGDPNRRIPNPAVGPLDKGPFYAFPIYPSDVGTCGGFLTDEFGRVIAEDGPVPGLYATGNGTATVMGRHYLGAGASIANTMIFGFIAARHAMGAGDGAGTGPGREGRRQRGARAGT
ncbi:FAD-dependent oxidoreductase [Arthrobacter sp. 3Tela_A]|uniref:FAD-dependent oxidoreductase n=1 Tax=Arthrobacter sp. 3Tela_A TaxID=3093743 RepID=UPI003BB80D28